MARLVQWISARLRVGGSNPEKDCQILSGWTRLGAWNSLTSLETSLSSQSLLVVGLHLIDLSVEHLTLESNEHLITLILPPDMHNRTSMNSRRLPNLMSAKAGGAVTRKPSLESFTEAGSECLRNNRCSSCSTRYQVRYISGKKTKDIVYDCKVAMKCRLLRWCWYVLRLL